jgi:hypothetical protein
MNISGNMASYSLAQSLTDPEDKQKMPGDVSAEDLLGLNEKKNSSSNIQAADEAKAVAKAKNDKAIKDFNDYMNKPTMEKYTEAWLEKHGISKEEFDKMSPEKKEALTRQMKEDIEREMKQAMEKKNVPALNILA